jgi:hypothetical protein
VVVEQLLRTSKRLCSSVNPLECNNGPDTVQRMTAIALTLNSDAQESLILDMVSCSPKVEQGLLNLVENATKKVPQ